MTDTTRLEELQRRVQRDPASIAFAALAEEYRRLGMFQESIEICRSGLQRHPAYLSARVTLGRALIEVGDYDVASTELEQVLRAAPENLAAIRALADIHRRRGEMPEVIEHYAETISEPEPLPVSAPEPAPAPVHAAVAVSENHPSAVQSSAVDTPVEPPPLARLEAFLAAIERARRDVIFRVAL
jgi:tetratricopeptide (TPR) repeat protein